MGSGELFVEQRIREGVVQGDRNWGNPWHKEMGSGILRRTRRWKIELIICQVGGMWSCSWNMKMGSVFIYSTRSLEVVLLVEMEV